MSCSLHFCPNMEQFQVYTRSTTCEIKTTAYFKTSTYPFAAATWRDVPPDLACRTSWIWPLLSHWRASLSMTRSSSFRAASMSTPGKWQRRPMRSEWHWRITCYLGTSCIKPRGWRNGNEAQLIIKVFIMSSACFTSRKRYVNDLLDYFPTVEYSISIQSHETHLWTVNTAMMWQKAFFLPKDCGSCINVV